MTKKGKVALLATIGLLAVTAVVLAMALFTELNKPEPVTPVVQKQDITISNCSIYVDGAYATSYRAFVHGTPVESWHTGEVVTPEVVCDPIGTVAIPVEELKALEPFEAVENTTPDPIVEVDGSAGVDTSAPDVPVNVREDEPSSKGVDSPTADAPIVSVNGSAGVIAGQSPASTPEETSTTVPDELEPVDIGVGTVGNAWSVALNDDGSFTCYVNGVWVGTVPQFIGCDVVSLKYEQGL